MKLAIDEFILLIHVLPTGFHRIRHYGLFADSSRTENIARARQLLNVPANQPQPTDAETTDAERYGPVDLGSIMASGLPNLPFPGGGRSWPDPRALRQSTKRAAHCRRIALRPIRDDPAGRLD